MRVCGLLQSYYAVAMAMCRALVRRVNRKVVRKKPGNRGRNVPQHIDPAFHQHLSMAHGEYVLIRIRLFWLQQLFPAQCYAMLCYVTLCEGLCVIKFLGFVSRNLDRFKIMYLSVL